VKGSVFRRCGCPVERIATGRRLACMRNDGSWGRGRHRREPGDGESVHTGGRPESLRRQGERAHSLSMTTAGRSYIYGQDRELEQARLAGLSAQFDPITIRHLASIGVEAGWHCLEVGAGAGSIARWLAAAVGGTGRVVATDLDTQFLDNLPRPPVEVVRHDIMSDPIEQEAFDLVHARAVLEHLPKGSEIIARLRSALRPGGVLMLEDLVFGAALLPIFGRIVSPPSKADAFARVIPAMEAGFRAAGPDPEFGLELPAALIAAGLREVDAELTCRLIDGGSEESAFYAMALQDLGPRLIAAGLLSEQDLAEPVEFVQDPASRWFSLGIVTAWGLRG
jgi:SAM-dependent methyltransferase